jgi:uncharacterized protein YegL
MADLKAKEERRHSELGTETGRLTQLKRPGGELSSRPLHFIWMVDCSGSMLGEKIGTVNHAIQATIPEMLDAANNNPYAKLLVRTLKFSTGASWVRTAPTNIENFAWVDLGAEGVTDLGAAFKLLSAELTIPPMSDRALPPVIVLLSDGMPTDDYKSELDALLALPWGKKAIRIAIAIGRDADTDVLQEFTGDKDLVLEAGNREMLVKMIKWASTAASMVSAPVAQGQAGDTTSPLNTVNMPVGEISDDDVW